MTTKLMLLALLGKLGLVAALVLAVIPPADPLSTLITYAGAAASVLALGAVKRTDLKVTNSKVYRKAQPFLALAGSFVIPLLVRKIGVPIDPQALVQAPLATIVSVGAAELLTLFRKPPA